MSFGGEHRCRIVCFCDFSLQELNRERGRVNSSSGLAIDSSFGAVSGGCTYWAFHARARGRRGEPKAGFVENI
jgi:hypothetical protein